MPKPPRDPSLGLSTRNPARVAEATGLLRRMSSTKAMKQIAGKFEISEREAWRVISDARKLIAAEADKERPQIRAMETVRLLRIAESAEAMARKARRQGEFIAASASHRTVIAASREIGRLNGAYAPDKVEVTHGAEPELVLQIDAILAILTDAGRAAMDVVMGEIERAKADGRLKLELDDGAGETLVAMS
jgi:hypothetical protein